MKAAISFCWLFDGGCCAAQNRLRASGGALQPAGVDEVKLTPSLRAAAKPSRRDPFEPVTKSQLCELVSKKANIREIRLNHVGKILSFITKIAKEQLKETGKFKLGNMFMIKMVVKQPREECVMMICGKPMAVKKQPRREFLKAFPLKGLKDVFNAAPGEMAVD